MARQIERKDIAAQVTDAIVKILETGAKPWDRPWVGGGALRPLRHNGEPYRGINILLLWGAAEEAGYVSPYWMTYQQAQADGGQVRKGERGTTVVYYGTAQKREAEHADENHDGSQYRFLKSFTVFNVQQIDGLGERYANSVQPRQAFGVERIPQLDAVINALGADIRYGGGRAYYRPATDHIQMPDIEAFPDTEKFYTTLLHESVHWTKAPHRLNRSFGLDTDAYAKEELVAELGSAFIGAELGLRPDHIEDHAAYIHSWIAALKSDKRFLLKAAAKAQQAADYILANHAANDIEEAA